MAEISADKRSQVESPVDPTAAVDDAVQHGVRMAAEARAMTASAGRAVDESAALVRVQLERRPYTTLAAAAGVGYVLGGGLGSPLTRFALRAVGRVLATYLVKEVLEPAAQGVIKSRSTAQAETKEVAPTNHRRRT